MAFFLLLAVITASPGLIILSNSTRTPFLLECRVPDNSSLDSVNVNLTQEDMEQLKIEGRCFLACATLRYNDQVIYNLYICIQEHIRTNKSEGEEEEYELGRNF